jgi:uncharacterized repeat protein (TIGR01451 family)
LRQFSCFGRIPNGIVLLGLIYVVLVILGIVATFAVFLPMIMRFVPTAITPSAFPSFPTGVPKISQIIAVIGNTMEVWLVIVTLEPVFAGESVTFTITLRNRGNTPLSIVSVTATPDFGSPVQPNEPLPVAIEPNAQRDLTHTVAIRVAVLKALNGTMALKDWQNSPTRFARP